MPSTPRKPRAKPQIKPQRRSAEIGPPTAIAQGYENMGPKGRRRLLWIGIAMLTASGGVGLFGGVLSFYRFIIVLAFAGLGSGFIFPQYGIMFVEKVLGPIVGSSRLLSRPDRRSENRDE